MLKNKVVVIAEAGVNHNGSLKKALKGWCSIKFRADYIKFQTFDPNSIKSKVRLAHTKERIQNITAT